MREAKASSSRELRRRAVIEAAREAPKFSLEVLKLKVGEEHPTFVTYRNHLRGDEAKRLLADDSEMRFVSPRAKQTWDELANQPVDHVTSLRQNIFPLSKEIFRRLRESGSARFLSGTDSGVMEMLIPGLALHEELQIFERLGMTPFEALQTATVIEAQVDICAASSQVPSPPLESLLFHTRISGGEGT